MTESPDGTVQDYWKRYYSPDEVEEMLSNTQTTMIISGGLPIHVRLWVQPRSAPTVAIGSSILSYGLALLRVQAPFYRAGFNVVQWDLPGWGQSGGARANCPISDFIRTWNAAIDFTRGRFTGPLYAMGLAEDSVTCYYAGANHPHLQALSLHTLHEYGDPDGVHWQGSPWLVRTKAIGVGLGLRIRPDLALRAEHALPWRAIFSGPDDGQLLRAFENDPLRVRQFHFQLVGSMMHKMAPPVAFEQCRTAVQVIASEKSSLWPYAMNVRYFNRLGGPKQLVTLENTDQWVYTREFHEMYARHVINWFNAHGGAS